MTELRHPVLIGDHNEDRAQWFGQFLRQRYNVASESADTFDKALKMARSLSWSVVFLADTLPFSYNDTNTTPLPNFSQLAFATKARLGCIVTQEEYPDLSGVRSQICYISLPSSSPWPDQHEQIVKDLKPLRPVLPPVSATVDEVKNLSSWDRQNRILYEQIRSLSLTQDSEEGQNHLYEIIRNCIECRGVEKIQIEPLTQGKSGARVFHLIVTPKADVKEKTGSVSRADEYVLKLSEAQNVWKLQSEVSGYLQAKKSELYSKYKAHVPSLEVPQISKAATEATPRSTDEPSPEEFAYIASNLSWDAIYYDFLGGSLGECMSLETALVSAPDKLLQKTRGDVNAKFLLPSGQAEDVAAFRLTFLNTVLSSLCDLWYFRCEARERRRLWESGNAPARQYLSLPPYQLTARTRQWVQEFLEGEEAEIGNRLFAEWGDCRDKVLALINCADTKAMGLLGEEIPVTLTPVHGDLNANNIFLWFKHDSFPFLIDLPFYQPTGHVLQDFARLEVDVKFALMDKQKESPEAQLAAYDYSPEQFSLWRELEDILLSNGTEEEDAPSMRSPGFKDNVNLTYRLVKLIRDKATHAQQQPCADNITGPVAFMNEYLPALLYHTVRAITYPSLSIFKRMLAVYSAGSILRRLDI